MFSLVARPRSPRVPAMLGFAIAYPRYGPIPFARSRQTFLARKGCCHISGLCLGISAWPPWTIRAPRPHQPIGLEGPWGLQVGEVPV